MLLNVHAKSWKAGLVAKPYEDHSTCNVEGMKRLVQLAKDYNGRVLEEEEKTALEMMVANVGKVDPKRHLQEEVEELIADNIDQLLTQSLGVVTM